MRIKTILATAFIAFSMNNTANAQSIQEGDVTIDAFYGFPYITGAFVENLYQENDTEVVDFTNTNHIGGKVDYAVSDGISLGGEFTFAKANGTFEDINNEPFSVSIQKIRFLGKITFHFATGDKLDPYFTTGVGYSGTKIAYVGVNEADEQNINLFPVAIRAGLGLRYFFTPNFGLNAEVGLGGPLAQAGLTARF